MTEAEQQAVDFCARLKGIMEKHAGRTYSFEEFSTRVEGIIHSWPYVIRLAMTFDRWSNAKPDSPAEFGLLRQLYNRFVPFVKAANAVLGQQPPPLSAPRSMPAPAGVRGCDAQHAGNVCIREHGHKGLHDSHGYAWGEMGEMPPTPLQTLWVSDLQPRLAAVLDDMERAGISTVGKVYLDPGMFTTFFVGEERMDVFAEIGLIKPALVDGWVPVPPEYVLNDTDEPELEPVNPRRPVTTGEA